MALKAEQLTFGYSPGAAVLRGVSASFEPATLTTVVGPNGAGKSTLLRLLAGVLRPTQGRVTAGGASLEDIPARARARRIAYVAQRPSLAFSFSLREYVRLGRFAAAGPDDDRATSAALAQLDLSDRADDPFLTLSAGQQQRAAVARALAQLDVRHTGRPCPACGYTLASDLAHCPECGLGSVLFLDEPVSAMDPRHALETLTLLRTLAGSGLSVIAVLHDLTLAMRFCNRALVLNADGRVAADGPVAEALAPAVLETVFGVRFGRVDLGAEGVCLVPSLLVPSR